jgi:hypothetical protein
MRLLKQMLVEVGGALERAHKLGVVHTDVRATNVIFAPATEADGLGNPDATGRFVLIDWGSAELWPAEAVLPAAAMGSASAAAMRPITNDSAQSNTAHKGCQVAGQVPGQTAPSKTFKQLAAADHDALRRMFLSSLLSPYGGVVSPWRVPVVSERLELVEETEDNLTREVVQRTFHVKQLNFGKWLAMRLGRLRDLGMPPPIIDYINDQLRHHSRPEPNSD